MKKRVLALLLTGVMCSFCACGNESSEENDAPPDTNVDVSVFENEKGNVVYHYNLDGETPYQESSEDTVVHRQEDKKVVAVNGGISLEKAQELLDSCSSYRLYLPGKISEFKKRFNDIIKFNNKDYYSISLYCEKDSVRLYVGSDIIVSCDGKDIYRLDVAGAYQKMEPGTAENDKSSSELYPDAKISPFEALFTINSYDRKKLGLNEAIIDYTFEMTDKIVVKNSIECYQITPKLRSSSSVKLCNPVYVAADGSGRVLAINKTKTDYELLDEN